MTVPKWANPAGTRQCRSSRYLRPPRIRQASREGEMDGREEREENGISGWRILGSSAINSLTVQMGMLDQRGAATSPRSQEEPSEGLSNPYSWKWRDQDPSPGGTLKCLLPVNCSNEETVLPVLNGEGQKPFFQTQHLPKLLPKAHDKITN